MGRRGPPPKPTRLKVAAGNPGKRPLNPAEPQPTAGAPKPPAWLPRRAKAEWRAITPELERLGLVTVIDAAALTGYCVAVSELEAATRTLEKEGRVCSWPILSNAGDVIGVKMKAHPCVAMQRDAARLVKQFIGEFGLTPASRTRVHGKPADGAAADAKGSRFFGVVG